MAIELTGGSLAGVVALAENQGAIQIGCAVWRDGFWRVRALLNNAR